MAPLMLPPRSERASVSAWSHFVRSAKEFFNSVARIEARSIFGVWTFEARDDSVT